MLPRTSIVVLEDRASACDSVRIGIALLEEDYLLQFVSTEQEAVRLLESCANLVLMIWHTEVLERRKEEFLATLQTAAPDLPVLLIVGYCSPDLVVSLSNQKSRRLLAKPISADQVESAARNMAERFNGRGGSADIGQSREFVGAENFWSQQIAPFLELVADSDIPVLIQGETGVGKEVIARAIHNRSGRALRPFVKLNCAALPAELVESELFGYQRGAFTGAFKNTPGKFEMAQRGVILLDEIADMEFRLQAKMLQVLQDQQFYSLGAEEPTQVDVRVIAATHCDLESAMIEGRFREDLYYRLSVATIYIPPLRERAEDIPLLAEHFLGKHAKPNHLRPALTNSLQEALISYDWPGNVRELENVIRKYLVVCRPEIIINDLQRRAERRRQIQAAHRGRTSIGSTNGNGHIPSNSNGFAEPMAEPEEDLMEAKSIPQDTAGKMRPQSDGIAATFADVESQRREAETIAILTALEATRWNRKQAATLLKVNYNVFLYRMKRLGITAEAAS